MKWLFAAVVSLLLSLFATLLYVVYLNVFPPQVSQLVTQNQNEDLLTHLGFIALVGVCLLINLVLVLESQQFFSHWYQRCINHHSSHMKQQFLAECRHYEELHELQALPISPKSYLNQGNLLHSRQLVYIERDNEQPLGIYELRTMFQQMLRYECRAGVLLCIAGVDAQADIFAKETGIEILNLKRLKKQLSC